MAATKRHAEINQQKQSIKFEIYGLVEELNQIRFKKIPDCVVNGSHQDAQTFLSLVDRAAAQSAFVPQKASLSKIETILQEKKNLLNKLNGMYPA